MNIADRIEQLLEKLARQQALPDNSWREVWGDLRGELEDQLATPGRKSRPRDAQGVKRYAGPRGAVIVFFYGTQSTLRYNAGGANSGWWFEGTDITETRAEEVLSSYEVRAVVKP